MCVFSLSLALVIYDFNASTALHQQGAMEILCRIYQLAATRFTAKRQTPVAKSKRQTASDMIPHNFSSSVSLPFKSGYL